MACSCGCRGAALPSHQPTNSCLKAPSEPPPNNPRETQECRWSFLVFSGSFGLLLRVAEDPSSLQLTFDLAQPTSFTREFTGGWTITPQPRGGCHVEHLQRVAPALSPPAVMSAFASLFFSVLGGCRLGWIVGTTVSASPRFASPQPCAGDYTGKIFRAQVSRVLLELQQEVEQVAAAEAAADGALQHRVTVDVVA